MCQIWHVRTQRVNLEKIYITISLQRSNSAYVIKSTGIFLRSFLKLKFVIFVDLRLNLYVKIRKFVAKLLSREKFYFIY